MTIAISTEIQNPFCEIESILYISYPYLVDSYKENIYTPSFQFLGAYTKSEGIMVIGTTHQHEESNMITLMVWLPYLVYTCNEFMNLPKYGMYHVGTKRFSAWAILIAKGPKSPFVATIFFLYFYLVDFSVDLIAPSYLSTHSYHCISHIQIHIHILE